MTNNFKDNLLANYEYKSYFNYELIKLNELCSYSAEDNIVGEYPLSIFINNKYYHTFFCTPYNLNELIIGYLFSKHLIYNKDDILSININKEERVAKISINPPSNLDNKNFIYLTNNNFINTKPIENDTLKIKVSDIYRQMKENLSSSELFQKTAGVHNISIYSKNKKIVSVDDIARHNALDKAIGHCILNNIPLNDKVVFLSGRISFEMIQKISKAQIPIVISKSTTTNLVIDLCKKMNITLVGFVRGEKMNIYANPSRILIK